MNHILFTWGIIGFTLKHGEIQRIVLSIEEAREAESFTGSRTPW